jgi:hypothetical protein
MSSSTSTIVTKVLASRHRFEHQCTSDDALIEIFDFYRQEFEGEEDHELEADEYDPP